MKWEGLWQPVRLACKKSLEFEDISDILRSCSGASSKWIASTHTHHVQNPFSSFLQNPEHSCMSIATATQFILGAMSCLFFRSLTIANAMRTTAWNIWNLFRAQLEISRGFAAGQTAQWDKPAVRRRLWDPKHLAKKRACPTIEGIVWLTKIDHSFVYLKSQREAGSLITSHILRVFRLRVFAFGAALGFLVSHPNKTSLEIAKTLQITLQWSPDKAWDKVSTV